MFSVQNIDGRLYRTTGDLVQDVPASPRYQVVDPYTLMEGLSSRYKVTVRQRIMAPHGRGTPGLKNPWIGAIDCRDKNPLDFAIEGYVPTLSILLPHNGHGSVKFKRGVVRTFCANQFTSGVDYSIHHCSTEIAEFLADPCALVNRLLYGAQALAAKVESLRSVEGGEDIVNAIAIARPRLGGALMEQVPQYQEGELSLWAVIQSLTGAKVPGLQRLSEDFLGKDWETFRAGGVPASVYA